MRPRHDAMTRRLERLYLPPGAPAAASVREMYGRMLERFEGLIIDAEERGELNAAGRWFASLALQALRREARG